MNVLDSLSTRPYLIRALYEWCTDNGFTPYVAVSVDQSVQVPREYVKNNEIVLNISFDATSSLQLGNEFIEFKARFAGSPREIMVPISHVIAIYARENGQGMAFPLENSSAAPNLGSMDAAAGAIDPPPAATPATSPPASPAQGPADESEGKIMQLVPEDTQLAGKDSPDSPEPPRPPPRTRPSLKRVK
ncbi:MAG: ClpXP protease specificity-enhancing factor [Polaromonas sp.]|nr:ClpXP protease specificity-enhancing factor [Polaromonas sp.]